MFLKKSKIFSSISIQILKNFIAISSIIFILILSNHFFLVINQSLTEGFFGSEIIILMFLKLFRDLPLVISLSFILSIVVTLNKLYKSSEMVFLSNAGIADFQIFNYLKKIIFFVSFLVLIMSISFAPKIKQKIEILKENIKSRPDYIFFQEAVFQNFNEKNITFYSPEITSQGEKDNQFFQDVFLYYEDSKKTVIAESGEKIINVNGDVSLNLNNGNIYTINTNNKTNPISITAFERLSIELYKTPKKINIEKINSAEYLSFMDLYSHRNKEGYIEILKRISTPFSLFIMSILSILLAKTTQREKRNFSVGYVFIFYILYYNILNFSFSLSNIAITEFFLIFFTIHFIPTLIILGIFLFRNNYSFNYNKIK